MRERLGIEPGAAVDVQEAADGSVVLRDVREQRRRLLREAQGSLKGVGGTVDDLIADRREEAAREAREARGG